MCICRCVEGINEKAWVGYLSSLRLMMEQATDVSKAEDDASGDGLTGVAAAEQSISITHCPVCTVRLVFTSFPHCTHNMGKLIEAILKLCIPDT